MKRLLSADIFLILLLLAGVGIGLIAISNRQHSESQLAVTPTPCATLASATVAFPPQLASPTPIPSGYVPSQAGISSTATPQVGEIKPTVEALTPTPLPISKTTDLASGFPDNEKIVFIID